MWDGPMDLDEIHWLDELMDLDGPMDLDGLHWLDEPMDDWMDVHDPLV
jgi:hypothetical protein